MKKKEQKGKSIWDLSISEEPWDFDVSESEIKEFKSNKVENHIPYEPKSWGKMDYSHLIPKVGELIKSWVIKDPVNEDDDDYRKEVQYYYNKIKKKDDFLEYCDTEWIEHHETKRDEYLSSLMIYLNYFDLQGKFDNNKLEDDKESYKKLYSDVGSELRTIQDEKREEKKRKWENRKPVIQSKGSLELFNIIQKLLGGKISIKQEYQFNPIRLYRLDYYFEYKDRKIGVEFQGIQHFQPVDSFGGKPSFKKVQKWDKEKKRLCDYFGIELFYFNYDEKLSEELVKNRIGIKR